MGIPLWSDLRDLDPGPRRFLFFHMFNVVSWQCIVGPSMILFARSIEMPPAGVGFLNAFAPLSQVLVMFMLPLVERFGPKRLMITTWMLRNIITCMVFAMPWALTFQSQWPSWALLSAAILCFCVTRAFGAGGWFPWLHEIIPAHQRHAYFSAEMSVAQVINVIVFAAQGQYLQGHPELDQYLTIYAVGIFFGILSILMLIRVPQGGAVPPERREGGAAAGYRKVISDRRYWHIVLIASLSFCALHLVGATWTMYLRDILHLSDRSILSMTALGGLCVLLTVRSWGRFADRQGSARAVILTMIGHGIFGFAFLFLSPDHLWTTAYAAVALCGIIIYGSAFWSSVHGLMLAYVPESGRVRYTNLWMVGTSLALGLTPIVAGWIVNIGGIWGFRTCFIVSACGTLGCALAIDAVIHGNAPQQQLRRVLGNPALAFRALGSIVWVTLGGRVAARESASI